MAFCLTIIVHHQNFSIETKTQRYIFIRLFAEELTVVLPHYVKVVFPSKVYFIRSPEKLGLIQACLMGTRNATGDVIVCMDNHMEVKERWSVQVHIWYFHNVS